MGNYPSVSGPVTVYITTENNAMVNISSSPFLNANIKSKTDKTVYFNSMSIISLPFTLTCEYLTVEPKAVIVQTSEPSTVTIFDSFGETTNDGTLIIPTNKLSTKYLVSSTMPVLNSVDFYSQFAIGALYDDTSVQIELKIGQNSSIHVFGGTYKDGDTFSVVLSRLETLQVNHTTDLTGTFITATKPLAVFSGKQCQLWKPSRCSHVVTQLPPISELDTHYIVAPFHNNEITLIRIVSAQETYINSSFGDKKITRHLYGRNPQNLTATSNSITVIVSDQPVLITGFGMGGPYDPYMTVIPGINQYLSYYKIPVPEGYTENFICVIIPQISLYNLRINGNSFNKFKTVFQSSIVLENIFSVFTIQVERGIFILSTTDNSKFGLIVYGHRYSDGYGFAGNFLLN
ncbi:IgGFc-binding protein-like [Saccostrea cucullata]|uniref:IgGFc-binding protein-like n=1 Tax=Saccostrea cuccullata TaxID=36930 RepID=UPI002ED65198